MPDSNASAAPKFPSTRRGVLSFAILLGVSAAVIALSPGIARAHAIVVAAQPAMNSTVAQGELEIKLDFNSQIDRKRSRLSLQRPDGSELVIALAPDNFRGYSNLGGIYVAMGQYQDAISALEKSVSIRPSVSSTIGSGPRAHCR